MKSSSLSVGNYDYALAYHKTEPDANKGPLPPVFVYVTQSGHASIGCYVYTIGKDKQTYSSVLQRGENLGLEDLATNLGRLISRKLHSPSYVCLSGHFEMSDYGELSREVLAQLSE